MNTRRSPLSIAAAAALCATAVSAQVDTSKWTCELCPAESGPALSGVAELGVAATRDDSTTFGNYTGLQRKGAHAMVGGGLRWRGDEGLYGSLSAQDLGLDTRQLAAELGREGQFRARIGYAEIPRHVAEGAMTPFLGVGGNVLTLPAGYPALSTGAMPLAATLQPVDLQTQRKRLDAGLTWSFGTDWDLRLQARHDVRDGLQRLAGSFFSTASQLPVPVDQTIDSLEAAATFTRGPWHASVGAMGSWFRNGNDALTWTNPFLSGSAGATRGELALAPDNQFMQLNAALAYDIGPRTRVSGDIAWGQMTQDAALRSASLNPALSVSLPVASIDGRVDVFNANLRGSAQPLDNLRLTATYARDVHDNRTDRQRWPAVTTDLVLGSTPIANQRFSFTRDLIRLVADLKAGGSLRGAIGLDHDEIERTVQEVVTTRDTTVWMRVSARPLDGLSTSLKLLHGERQPNAYGTATWISPAENPALRKFNMATRVRDAAKAQLDATLGEGVGLTFTLDAANDGYGRSAVGLTASRTVSVGVDLSAAISDETQAHLFAQGEHIRSRQAGSQASAGTDWTATSRDRVHVFGAGLRHSALKGRLELGAELTFTRSWSDVRVDTGATDPGFPTARTQFDGARVSATWKLQDRVAIVGSYGYEDLRSNDWHLDGVTPGTVPVLLTLGDATPRYRANVLRVAMRYSF